MKIITWNVQWCRGVDQRVDPARIVAHAKALADFDVLCLQEIASNFPDPRLPGSRGENQFAAIAQQLPDFTAVPGAVVDVPGEPGQRRHFGNMILSRLPVGQVFRHLLPFPVDPGQRGMPRIALEAVARAVRRRAHHHYAPRVLRNAPTEAQVEALRAIYAEGSSHARLVNQKRTAGRSRYRALPRRSSPATSTSSRMIRLHARMVARCNGTPPLSDAWEAAHPGIAHPATFKIYDKESPDEPEQHCDFIFVSADLVPRLKSIRIDQETQASDHQPVLAEFD
jgi:endonuclease/exonuclease/phosphatase family metal-dependent hydrolase